ncbi:uncharacterized protein BJX67DRAFT_385215 [Aspergillus lucknowensis]|uniref:Uncharacterized protein n=1 Tax=Aspergillus lucknowensis TaxID=176173 RepID=A0ABR4LEH5_9EURO
MTTYPGRGQSLDLPEFDDLEIRCTWSGEYEEEANLRISLEVKCAPNTQLQLLDARGSDILFVGAFTECVSKGGYHAGNRREDDAPKSPLFGFSPLGGDGAYDIDPIPGVQARSGSTQLPGPHSISQDDDKQAGGGKYIRHYCEDPNAELSLIGPTSQSPLISPCSGFRKPENSTKSRKRSATDADLTDSGPDNETDSGGVLTEIINRRNRQASAARLNAGDKSPKRTITSPTSLKKPQTKRVPGLAFPNENEYPTSLSKSTGPGQKTPERLGSPRLSVFEAKHSQKHSQKRSKIPRPTFTQESRPSESLASSIALEGNAGLQVQDVSNEHAVAYGATIESITELKSGVNSSNQATDSVTIGMDFSSERPLSPASSKNLETQFDVSDACGEDTTLLPSRVQTVEGSSRHQEHEAEGYEPSSLPEVKIVEGLIVLDNSQRVHPATFRVTITASIYLSFPNEKGWSDLMIPGLPRTGNGRSGFFLFLMPVRHGLELRTTNMKRAKMVENCFIAEFVNAGNLVLPMRRCDRDFCGDITDFTVDQEIVAHCVVKQSTIRRVDGPKFELKYHAMCSVRLHNRCFWAERCCILLYLDGGPEGVFHCDLSTQKGGLKKIHILAGEYAEIGVSCIRVICSPRDLESLCVTWVTSGTGREAAYWLPRIYPASSVSREWSRDSLRLALYDMLNESNDFFADFPARRPECESEGESEGDHFELAPEDVRHSLGNISSSRPAFKVQILSRMDRAVQLHLIRWARSPIYFLKWTLIGVLFLAFLGIGSFILARSSHPCPTPSALLLDQVRLEVPEPADRISLFGPPNESMDSDGVGMGQGMTAGGLNVLRMLSGYRANGYDSAQPRASMWKEGEHSEPELGVGKGVGDEVNAKSQFSVRDRIDYWLGWTGPLE